MYNKSHGQTSNIMHVEFKEKITRAPYFCLKTPNTAFICISRWIQSFSIHIWLCIRLKLKASFC